MTPLTPQTLKGTWATVLLPLNERSDIIWKHIDEQLNIFAEAGVSGIYFNGTAGEFFSQSENEFLKLAQTIATFCESRGITFQIGASHAHASESLRRIEQTRDLNPGAFQVILPEWIPHTFEEIAAFIIRIAAAASPIPLVIYNPPNARKVLTPKEWKELISTTEGIIGIKVAGGDDEWHEAMQPVADKISVFVAGVRLATGMINGCASGSYSNLACLSPKGAIRFEHLIETAPEKALAQQAHILEVFEKAIAPIRGRYSDSALDKTLATAGGWGPMTPRVRWPLSKVPDEEVTRIAKIFQNELPFLFTQEPLE